LPGDRFGNLLLVDHSELLQPISDSTLLVGALQFEGITQGILVNQALRKQR